MISDTILFWKTVALEVHRRACSLDGAWRDDECGRPRDQMLEPGQGCATRAIAMVHLAMDNAVRSTDPSVAGNSSRQHLPTPPANASVEAAIGAAAGIVLAGLFRRQVGFIQQKQIEWIDHLAANGQTGSSMSDGADFGTELGIAMLGKRHNDPSDLRQTHIRPGPRTSDRLGTVPLRSSRRAGRRYETI